MIAPISVNDNTPNSIVAAELLIRLSDSLRLDADARGVWGLYFSYLRKMLGYFID